MGSGCKDRVFSMGLTCAAGCSEVLRFLDVPSIASKYHIYIYIFFFNNIICMYIYNMIYIYIIS